MNSHPIQYFAPLYAYLNRDPALEITTLYCSDFSVRGGVDPGFGQSVTWDVDLLTGYNVRWLGDRAKQRTPRGFWSLICPQVWSEIRNGKYDAVMLHGYGYAAYLLAFFAAKWHGLPVFVRSETHLGLERTAFRRWLRDSILSFAYRFVCAFLAIGSANRDYYRSLGVPDTKIFDVPYTVDNDRFMAAATLSEAERADVRRRFGLAPDRAVVLYASKFMRRKHPDDLVRAMASLRREGVHASLLLVGTGELEGELRALVSTLGLDDVKFGGFVNQSELPRVLAAADIFVLPAQNEPWGLIVNEAMCAGLPVLVGEGVGCVPDLVRSGVTGFKVQPGNVSGLADKLRQLLLDAELRSNMGKRALADIRAWNYERCRMGLRAAALACRK